MEIHILILLCVFGIAIAFPTNLAADPPIETSMRRVGKALEQLDSQWKTTTPWADPGDLERQAATALSLTNNLLGELRTASRDIKKGPNISGAESSKLRDWSDSITKLFQSTMKGWIGAKPIVVKAGKRSLVLDALLDLSDAVGLFNDAINGKMLVLAQTLGQGYKILQVAAVNSAVNEYKK
jgi:hypothetical protein